MTTIHKNHEQGADVAIVSRHTDKKTKLYLVTPNAREDVMNLSVHWSSPRSIQEF
jgi:hypothetical protein